MRVFSLSTLFVAALATCVLGHPLFLRKDLIPHNVDCGDGKSECPDSSTCCLTASGNYGCCPKKNAVCCPDKVHCCPEGFACEDRKGMCKKRSVSVSYGNKILPASEAPLSVICPDQKSECPSGNTCCITKTDTYACCAKENATCCPDHLHCCPHGYKCDNATGSCKKPDSIVPMLKKIPSRSKTLEVICEGGKYSCPDNHTCCNITGEVKGCCPIENAVCCTNSSYCCPNGFTCGSGNDTGKCFKSDATITTTTSMLEIVQLHTPQNIFCPDNKSQCNNNNTCCKTLSGNYGCCPEIDGVCCADKVHCCPKGDRCDTKDGYCIKSDGSLPSLAVKLQQTLNSPQGIVCPDSQSECPDRTTCCEQKAGNYGCCPKENGVCCSDKLHCCPHGYKCDNATGLCKKPNSIVPMLKKIPARKIPSRSKAPETICPGGKYSCPDNYKCCVINETVVGCCPIEDGVCCADKGHCCPNGFTCGSGNDTGKCFKSDATIVTTTSMLEIVQLHIPQKNIQCPDGESECNDNNTCCKTLSGNYGCCPEIDGVCCADKMHCCPKGDRCDTKDGYCIKSDSSLPSQMVKLQQTLNSPQGIICPNSQSECPDKTTCCEQKSGSYGCCPQENGVCCSDKLHCCPHGYTCDLTVKKCLKADQAIPFLTHVSATPGKQPIKIPENIECPDGKSQCANGNTCCITADGNYGCCPEAFGVCCPDKKHCCPQDYSCDPTDGKCTDNSIPFQDQRFKSASVLQAVKAPENTKCPDGKSECANGNTCCITADGNYGCCPVQNAICCSDHVHCCPEGYKCEVSQGKCTKGDESIAFLDHLPSVTIPISNIIPSPNAISDTIVSPDVEDCPGCPYGDSGVCCPDGVHCCPAGYSCVDSVKMCVKGDSRLPFLSKVQAINTPENIVCPDSVSQCADGNTCCLTKSGNYACCPKIDAVCCPDKVHCCPKGFTCEDSKGECKKGEQSVPFLNHLPTLNTPTISNTESTVCPDKLVCPTEKSTCCERSTGIYGCCPYSNAQCCSNKLTCCPSGYNCNGDKCVKKSVSLPFLNKPDNRRITLFKEERPDPTLVTCPDQQSVCPDGDTCCRTKDNTKLYNCCPEPHAVCCSDGTHCCPKGYKCDSVSGHCTLESISVPFIDNTPSIPISIPVVDLQVGQKQKFFDLQVEKVFDKCKCSADQTCCTMKNGEQGCCNFADAVCCGDEVHCCPNGFDCDVSQGICVRKRQKFPFLQKLKVIGSPQTSSPTGEILKVKDNKCSGRNNITCTDGQTCCPLPEMESGCCPMVNAVCCGDRVHCCPPNYSCDITKQECVREKSTTSLTQLIGASESSPNDPQSVDCPDKSKCPDAHTCCLTGDGSYGCCNHPQAQCCMDKVHCCPKGFSCDDTNKNCKANGSFVPFLTMQRPPKKDYDILASKDIPCPDGSTCDAGQTCCHSSSKVYACCPVPNAVCCSDDKHCCPVGYTCRTATGKCIKGSHEIELFVKLPPLRSPQVVTCPDNVSACPDKQTCCKDSVGEMRCCTIEDAICCSDGEHCCPRGFKCDLKQHICTKSSGNHHALFLTEKKQPTNGAIVCPDSQSECPSGTTCCKLSSGAYGCCPLPKAVCCEDDKYCCPENSICDMSTEKCINKDNSAVPLFTKTLARVASPQDVVCPDGKTKCPNKNTCCQLDTGGYACCGSPQGTCCPDKIHCCPHNYNCQPGSNKCVKNLDTVLALFLTPPPLAATTATALNKPTEIEKPSKPRDSVCSDREHWCPDNTTCCAWGCCRISDNAVCCGAMEHCCAAGFTCGSDSSCVLEVPMVSYTPSVAVEETQVSAPDVVCPDSQSQCPKQNTCCKSSSTKEEFGCCPTPKAVCCPDFVHCCPEGTECDTKGGMCREPGSSKITSYKEAFKPMKLEKVKTPNIVCPDKNNQCPKGNICCRSSSNSDDYGCCPSPKGVCCPDYVHCCPEGTECDTAGGKCRKPPSKITSYEEAFKLLKLEKVESPSIFCPGEKNQCPEGNICCKSSSKSDDYGCCPSPKGVCCPDYVHCCPEGTECDTAGGKCRKPPSKITSYEEAFELIKLQNFEHDDQLL